MCKLVRESFLAPDSIRDRNPRIRSALAKGFAVEVGARWESRSSGKSLQWAPAVEQIRWNLVEVSVITRLLFESLWMLAAALAAVQFTLIAIWSWLRSRTAARAVCIGFAVIPTQTEIGRAHV